MESANLEMVKRLKYTKDILTHMLNSNVADMNKNNPTDKPEVDNENPSLRPTNPKTHVDKTNQHLNNAITSSDYKSQTHSTPKHHMDNTEKLLTTRRNSK